jgi:N-acyl-D-amino-acid deacylase
MRSEGNQLIEATQEAIAIAKAGDARLQVSHIKTSGRDNWQKFDTLMATLAQGRADGLQITADRYPYIYSRTGLRMTLPEPFNSIPGIVKYLNEHPEADDEIKALWKKKKLL